MHVFHDGISLALIHVILFELCKVFANILALIMSAAFGWPRLNKPNVFPLQK